MRMDYRLDPPEITVRYASFMDAATDRDWSNDTCISMLLEFIDEHSLEDELTEFANRKASSEDEIEDPRVP